ncbi:MAG: carbamate kinase [Candidatus Heimdallarchaeota archaeon]|nr:carbamate kinase [Candidatus Heimdallarchaeota archaeon]
MKRVVVALGGNALSDAKKKGEPFKEQLEKIRNTANTLAKLVAKDYTVVITHGNGPQVGSLLLQQQADVHGSTNLPLNILGALSQGQIGVALQHALVNELRDLGLEKKVYVIPTTVIVDKNDPGFSNPTKPIGPFYNEEEYRNLYQSDHQYTKKNEGYRRVVASPQPLHAYEADLIKQLMEENHLVVAVGGGGSPTIDDGKLQLVDAVIDKDLASAVLASSIGADMLVILTNVDGVYRDFGTDKQKLISKLSGEEARSMLETNAQAMSGSMGPKINACLNFKGESLITSVELLFDALEGTTGTRIIN